MLDPPELGLPLFLLNNFSWVDLLTRLQIQLLNLQAYEFLADGLQIQLALARGVPAGV